MPYDPELHRRRSTRLAAFDYRSAGAYFVTICTWQRECILADSRFAAVVGRKWRAIVNHGNVITPGEFVVMPNHVHGKIWIGREQPTVGARHGEFRPLPDERHADNDTTGAGTSPGASPLRPACPHGAPPGSLGAIVGAFKSVTARRINRIRHTPGLPVWQRNYHEHVIRDEADLRRVREYIVANPANWANDPENARATRPAPLTV